LWLPFKLFDTRLDIFVHFDDSFFNERLLNIIEACNNSVIILDDKFKWNNLSSVDICLLEQFWSSLRNTFVELFKILYLTKQSNQNGIEVDFQQSILFVFTA